MCSNTWFWYIHCSVYPLLFFILFLQSYQEHLQIKYNAGSSLNSTVTLLSLFNDKMYITSVQDKRLKQLQKFYIQTKCWANETEGKPCLFLSSKLWFDLQSMCLGLSALVSIKLSQFPQSVVKPCIINQDCVKNHFGQVRSCNGQNNNPTYLQQQSMQNSIRIGQTFISPKTNAGKSS
jgi:hypothetical protein